MNTRFVIFTCGWNCEKYVENNIKSIKSQSYKNYIHVVIDDASEDNTSNIIKKNQNDKMVFHINKTNGKWIHNSLLYLNNYIKSNNDVLVFVDMDDWLAHNNVLYNLNEIYKDPNIWITYSMFEYLKTGKLSNWIPKYDNRTILRKLFRSSTWSLTHLRTMRAFLWRGIKVHDLKDAKKRFFRCTYDMAIFFPALEMASGDTSHIKYVDDLQYIYNDKNEHNVNRSSLSMEQKENEIFLRKKTPYLEIK